MRLLIDMDGVTADLVSHWIALINRYHGEKLTVEDVTDWYVHKITRNTTKEQVDEFLKDPGFFRHLDPIPQALATLKQLMAEGHDVIFVTHCKFGHEDKRVWIEHHLPGFPMENIIFAERKELVIGDLLLDDGLHNLEAWQEAHPNGVAVCFDTPYNQEWEGHRVYCWIGFHTLVKSLENQP
jgi:5'-nucleotidase